MEIEQLLKFPHPNPSTRRGGSKNGSSPSLDVLSFRLKRILMEIKDLDRLTKQISIYKSFFDSTAFRSE